MRDQQEKCNDVVVMIMQLLESDWCHSHSNSAKLHCTKIPWALFLGAGATLGLNLVALLTKLMSTLYIRIYSYIIIPCISHKYELVTTDHEV